MSHLEIDRFRALIFDLDGTLIDSMPAHNQAWLSTLAQHNLALDEGVLFELAGISTLRTVEILNRRFGWDLDPHGIAQEKDSLRRRHSAG